MIKAFQQYQIDFTRHIRDPINTKRPDKVSKRGMSVYQEIVFNNIESTVSSCFPVLHRVLGKRNWLRLVRNFFIHHSCQTPIFREIPEEFLSYLNQQDNLPRYAKNLAHYEWIELYVAYAESELETKLDQKSDLLDALIVFAPVNVMLTYDYPVQMISPKFKPEKKLDTPVHLMVFRNLQDQVKFAELNATTAFLIEQLQVKAVSARQILMKMADDMGAKDVEAIINFGHDLLKDLMRQELIIGTRLD
jgi:hypothetical protein